MAGMAADALGQQLFDLLSGHVQLTQEGEEDAAGHLTAETPYWESRTGK